MNNKYWFENKKYGWGFVPHTWEGWVATLVLLILLVISLHTNGFFMDKITPNTALRVVFDIFVITSVFTLTMKDKVRGGLKWHWDAKPIKKKSKRRKKR